jgi:hypothetical protein
MLRNLGGIGDTKLFEQTLSGTKEVIEEYTACVARVLKFLCDTEFVDLPLDKKFDFFYEIRQTFGRSALLLSGSLSPCLNLCRGSNRKSAVLFLFQRFSLVCTMSG